MKKLGILALVLGATLTVGCNSSTPSTTTTPAEGTTTQPAATTESHEAPTTEGSAEGP